MAKTHQTERTNKQINRRGPIHNNTKYVVILLIQIK